MVEYGLVARKVRFSWVSPLSIFMQRKNKLLQYNASTDVFREVSECECKNLWCFVRHGLLEVQVKKEVLADGEVRRRPETGIFFKSSIIHPSRQKFLAEMQLWTILNKLLILKVLFSTLWKETK